MMLFFAGRGRDGRGSRALIRAMVEAEPGIHIAELAQRTGLSWHTTAYHLRLLEKQRVVSLEKGQRERRAFPAGIPDLHRRWLAGLRTDKAAELLRSLLEDPRQTVPSPPWRGRTRFWPSRLRVPLIPQRRSCSRRTTRRLGCVAIDCS